MVLLSRKSQTRSRESSSFWKRPFVLTRVWRVFGIWWLLVSLLTACAVEPFAALPAATPTSRPLSTVPPADADIVVFPNGHTLRGAFRRFWEAHNGAALFGSPLTEQLWVDERLVQYFERARFELWPTDKVMLGAVGREVLVEPEEVLDKSTALEGCRFFPGSGHNLCGAFKTFWEEHNGGSIFGAPISETTTRGSVQVQYFEHARFEQHAEGPVRLANVGDEVLARLPAHTLLRDVRTTPTSVRAHVVHTRQTVQPFDAVRTVLELADSQQRATVHWGDSRGHVWSQEVELVDGRAELEHVAQGALGPHGAVVMLGAQVAGVSTNVYRLDAASTIVTGQPHFDELLPRIKAFMDQDVSEYMFGPYKVRGYRSPDNNLLWLRDHVHQGKGYAYWERDMISLLDQFRRYQHPDGSFDDYLANFEFGEVRGRKEVEADLEYLFIEGVYRAWQATGDDQWLSQQFEAMERGLDYALTNPLRWDETHQLVKRPYTIDTWDFEIGQPTVAPDGNIAPRHWIDVETKWSIFHGDNTGYAHAMQLLARMYEHVGNTERAAHWRSTAQGIMERLTALAWNGYFYQHMVPLVPVDVPVDVESQLSLSNAYALNRGVLQAEQAKAIIFEYQSRRRPPDQAFAEWYSIDPPFPAGVTSMPEWSKGHRPGEYVNGGIMPLVGGELAQGAFNHGFETYGFDILQRYYSLIAGTGASYLWYYPLGQPGISGAETLPTDGWGASAMLAALVEGAAGVKDDGTAFSRATLSPRWAAINDVQDAKVTIRYGASDGYVAYHWQREEQGLSLQWTGSAQQVTLRVLLPADVPSNFAVTLDGQPQPTPSPSADAERYMEFVVTGSGKLAIRW